MARFLVVLLLGAITALLWLSYDFASTHQVFGATAVPVALHVAASIAAAVLFVVLVGQIVVRYGLARALPGEPTDLQRRLVAALLSFAAIATVLAHFGFDFSSILVFSALITAVVGLSIQPMLGGLLSGLAVNPMVRVGDGFILNGEAVEITTLNWRSAVGHRADGATIVLPNARLAENTMEIFARDRPVRAEARFDASLAMPPHRLQKLASDIIAELPEVDLSQPIVVLPINLERSLPFQVTMAGDSEHLSGRYRALFTVRQFTQRVSTEARVLRRLWYALRRENLVAPAGSATQNLLDSTTTALRALDGAAGVKAEAVIAAGEALLYDDGERIALPDRLAGRVCLLVDGALAETQPGRVAVRAGHGLSREASLGRIRHLLTERIGPYADYAVDQAAAGGTPLATVCRTVAEEIDDLQERARFLALMSPPEERIHLPGLLFATRRNRAHRLVSEPPLRAVDHALILAVPEQALRNSEPK